MIQRTSRLKRYINVVVALWRANPLWLTLVLTGLLGALTYVIIYGITILNPTHVEWLLMSSGDPLVLGLDLKQHYLGWVWFRDAPWAWPVGLITTQAYPTGISVTFMDAIPLLAIPLKALSWLLPADFQYIALWQFGCFILQGMLAGVIIRTVSKRLWVILAGTVFFVLCPVLLARTFFHEALVAQWLILLSIALLLYAQRFSIRRTTVLWTITLTLAVLIHPYFIPIIAPLFFAMLVATHRSWKASLTTAIIPIIVSLSVFWMIGGFVPADINSVGRGFHPFDLASPFQSMGWSIVPNIVPIIAENTLYVGLGVIYGFVLAVTLFTIRLVRMPTLRPRIWKVVRTCLSVRYVIIYAGFMLLLIIAASPVIRWNDVTLFSYDVPQIVDAFWGVFRASVRLVWPLYYLFVVGVVFALVKLLGNTRLMVGAMLVLACVQIIDVGLSPNTLQAAKDVRYIQTIPHTPLLHIPTWLSFTDGKKHLIYVDSILSIDDSYALSDVATPARLTMNDAYYARSPRSAIQNTKEQALISLRSGILDSDTVYITKDKSVVDSITVPTKTLFDNGYYAIITK